MCSTVAKIYNRDRKIGSKHKKLIDCGGDRQLSITIGKTSNLQQPHPTARRLLIPQSWTDSDPEKPGFLRPSVG
ncbi:MAG: hypothetical protein EAZ60_03575 [Oscillatoriales cyanobacterium]|nr:MAG: hypothetical protein EAZ83_21605 [Oscillatoriales cyanobacterium]TAE97233.1 MAG: hypothetical protein EAZ79_11655 [Oscillatoriales cyanobacterium]TAF23123.1 MAG: hypothetical protein EAZ73_02645 [Oscillatoriales cyanobacterium]TAF58342.1 MAG: hypothetical protein EAZ60_03575 [Oscillatoriales cyanobacterium]